MQQERIELRWGRLNLKTLAFAIPSDWKTASVMIRLNGKGVSNRALFSNGRTEIELNETLTLSAGDSLQIEISQRGPL